MFRTSDVHHPPVVAQPIYTHKNSERPTGGRDCLRRYSKGAFRILMERVMLWSVCAPFIAPLQVDGPCPQAANDVGLVREQRVSQVIPRAT